MLIATAVLKLMVHVLIKCITSLFQDSSIVFLMPELFVNTVWCTPKVQDVSYGVVIHT